MKVSYVTIDESADNQRLDNYLTACFKGVPTSRIYRAIRKGEVRVNQKKATADYRLCIGDEVRLPPLRVPVPSEKPAAPTHILTQLAQAILFESDDLLIINKPAGIPVHGGSGVHTGVIEALRELRPQAKVLELVHRLDRGTSGCLMIAKKRSMLVDLHALLTHKKVHKQYLALVKGQWQGNAQTVTAPLKKNVLSSGERIVKVDENGKAAVTRFRPIQVFADATLVEAQPLTGRTHQIRVHAAHLGHPIAGDEKYGDPAFNKQMRALGLKRMFLHAGGIYCTLPENQSPIGLCALLDPALLACLAILRRDQKK